EDRRALVAEQVGTDDRLREAGLVLEREENESLRGAGSLADDDRAGGDDAAAVRHLPQLRGGEDAVLAQLRPEVLEQMPSRRQLHRHVVGERLFDARHLGQGMWSGGLQPTVVIRRAEARRSTEQLPRA